MADTNVFVLCGNNCKYEGMTKEQIIAAIAEATGKTPTNIDDAFITKIKEQNKGGSLKVWRGTTAEYNAIIATSGKDADTIYIKTDDSRDADVDAAIRALGNEVDKMCTYVARKTVEGLEVILSKGAKRSVAEFTRFNANAVAIPVITRAYYDEIEQDVLYPLPVHIMGDYVGVFNTFDEDLVVYVDVYEIGIYDGEGTNSGGGGGIETETDPTVPAWAKQPQKPRYTANEVGADAFGTADSAVAEHDVSADAHGDIRHLVATARSRLDALERSAVLYTTKQTLTDEQKAQARANIGVVSTAYIISVFEELKAALEESDIEGAVAVLDEAILDLSTLA